MNLSSKTSDSLSTGLIVDLIGQITQDLLDLSEIYPQPLFTIY